MALTEVRRKTVSPESMNRYAENHGNMLYSQQWQQLMDWSSRAPLWVIIGMTPVLPIVMVFAGICYFPRFCAVGICLLGIAYGLLLWIGAQPILLGRELAKAILEFYLLTAVTMFFGLMELVVKRRFAKNSKELTNKNSASDEPSDPPKTPAGRELEP